MTAPPRHYVAREHNGGISVIRGGPNLHQGQLNKIPARRLSVKVSALTKRPSDIKCLQDRIGRARIPGI